MADIVRYVDTGADAGGDGTTAATSGANCAYQSLSQWEAATQADITGTGDAIVHCNRTNGGGVDTTAFTMSGWTTDATHEIIITQDDFPDDGVFDDTKYYLFNNDSATQGILIQEDFVTIDKLQIAVYQTGSNTRYGIYISGPGAGSTLYFKKVILKGTNDAGAAGACRGIANSDADATAYYINCIAYGFLNSTRANAGYYPNAGANYYYNCVASGNRYGIGYSGTFTAKNCACFNNYDDFAGTGTIDHCASDDGDGTNAQDFTSEATDWNKVFTDYSTADFTLKNYTTPPCCIGVGTDDPGSGLYSDDIIGTARSSTWDIGAFEYVVPAAGGGQVIMISN